MINVIASSETVSIVNPTMRIAKSVTKSEVGIAIITTSELRHERKKKSIAMPVKAMPSISVWKTPKSSAFVSSAWTFSTLKAMSGYCASILGSAATAASDEVTSLAPVAFCSVSVIAGAPFTYE